MLERRVKILICVSYEETKTAFLIGSSFFHVSCFSCQIKPTLRGFQHICGDQKSFKFPLKPTFVKLQIKYKLILVLYTYAPKKKQTNTFYFVLLSYGFQNTLNKVTAEISGAVNSANALLLKCLLFLLLLKYLLKKIACDFHMNSSLFD